MMAGADALAHLPADLRPVALLGNEVRIAHVRGERWVPHAAAERLLAALQDAVDRPRRDRMENVLLLGESGAGKTMLLRKFERSNAAAFDGATGVERRPVVAMLMPPQPTEAEFYDQLLRALGAPHGGRAGERDRLHRRETALRLLREVDARVLVVDEINSVLAGTPRQQRLFLQLLRFLSNEGRLPLVCAGVPEARHALLSDPQLRGRFAERELPPWIADDELRGFVWRLVWSLPLREPSPVDGPRVLRLLAERSGGVTLAICRAVERAAVAAIRDGRERIDQAALENAAVWEGLMLPPWRLGRVAAPPAGGALPAVRGRGGDRRRWRGRCRSRHARCPARRSPPGPRGSEHATACPDPTCWRRSPARRPRRGATWRVRCARTWTSPPASRAPWPWRRGCRRRRCGRSTCARASRACGRSG